MEINIQEILKKHHCYHDSNYLAKIADGKPGSIGERYDSAIKEIITEVLKEAADSAEITGKYDFNSKPFKSYNAKLGFTDHGSIVRYELKEESITSTINKVKF